MLRSGGTEIATPPRAAGVTRAREHEAVDRRPAIIFREHQPRHLEHGPRGGSDGNELEVALPGADDERRTGSREGKGSRADKPFREVCDQCVDPIQLTHVPSIGGRDAAGIASSTESGGGKPDDVLRESRHGVGRTARNRRSAVVVADDEASPSGLYLDHVGQRNAGRMDPPEPGGDGDDIRGIHAEAILDVIDHADSAVRAVYAKPVAVVQPVARVHRAGARARAGLAGAQTQESGPR
jgi:hypothetical protein